MKNYIEEKDKYIIELENGKKYFAKKEEIHRNMELLETDLEDALLLYLEDKDILINEEQEELDKSAKGVVKVGAESKPKAKTPRERVTKPQPEKEFIINLIATELIDVEGLTDLNVENKAKLITFKYKNQEYKIDLVQKRVKKDKTE